MRHFLQVGIHPELSLAEAASILPGSPAESYGAFAVYESPAWDGAALQKRLGGAVKLGDLVWEGPAKDIDANRLADLIELHPRGARILFGLSEAAGGKEKTWKFLPIQLKKELKRRGKSVRWVTGENGDLTPAAVDKLDLTTEGYDFILARHGSQGWIGLTTHVQDATSWSIRDFDKPFRDAKTGMLPPKLARMMVNLAVGARDPKTLSLLDPFCGSGTVLMEATVLGLPRLHGNDIDAAQTAGAERNLAWLCDGQPDRTPVSAFTSKPAQLLANIGPFDAIVTEGYLGKPLRGHESDAFLQAQKHEVEELWEQALPTLSKLQPICGSLVCTTPVYLKEQSRVAVDIAEAARSAGYEPQGTYLYKRADQHVARQVQSFKKTR